MGTDFFFFPPPKERLQSELRSDRKEHTHTHRAMPGAGKLEFVLALEGGYSTPEPQNLRNGHQDSPPVLFCAIGTMQFGVGTAGEGSFIRKL